MIVLNSEILDNSTTAQKVVVRTTGLSKTFKKFVAVQDVNLQVYQGDVFGLLGPNGSGKTTIIRLLLGLIEPSAGEGRVFGFDTIRQRAELLRRVSAIIESPAMYPGLTGRENLQAVAVALNLKELDRIEELLNMLGLGEAATKRYGAYSLGMKQRLGIAVALLKDPEMIILDEPTNGLDPSGMAEMRQLIRNLAAEGRTVFLSSHLLNEVQQVCNRVAILQKGKVIVQGLVKELLQNQIFVQVKVQPDERRQTWQLLEEAGWTDKLRLEGEYILVPTQPEQASHITRLLANKGIYVGELVIQNQTLEEYYLTITGNSRFI
jgi:ABC-2 type transport system ATP-binding protein